MFCCAKARAKWSFLVALLTAAMLAVGTRAQGTGEPPAGRDKLPHTPSYSGHR